MTRLRLLALEDRLTPAAALFEGFDGVNTSALPSGWTAAEATGNTVTGWKTRAELSSTSYRAFTAPNFAQVKGVQQVADQRLTSAAVSVPNTAGVQLKFRHSYYFNISRPGGVENFNLNGGVLEIRVGGGAFQDIVSAGGTFAEGGYTGTVDAGTNNPLAGRTGWADITSRFLVGSLVWKEVAVNLPSSALGQSVQFRWRMGTTDDARGTGAEWDIDNVRVGLPATTLAVTAGDDQTTPIRSLFARPLTVRVTDANGNGLPGEGVAFNTVFPAGGGAGQYVSMVRQPYSASLTYDDTDQTVVTDADGYARVKAAAQARSGTYQLSAASGSLPAVTFTETAVGKDFGRPLLAAFAAGPGGGGNVVAYDQLSTAGFPTTGFHGQRFNFVAYPGFNGGVNVTLGDVTGDGLPDIITGAGATGGPHVKVFDGETGLAVRSFFAFDQGFTGGVSVASADLNGDGFAEMVIGAGPGGGPHVKVFSGKDGTELRSFFAYDPGFRGGVSVAAIGGQIVTGAGLGGGPHVKVWDYATKNVTREFFAFNASFVGGVSVSAGDLDNDGVVDIIAGQLTGGSAVSVRNGATGATTTTQPFDGFPGGVNVAARDVNSDGIPDLVTTARQGGGPRVKSALSASIPPFNTFLPDFFLYDPNFGGGVSVG